MIRSIKWCCISKDQKNTHKIVKEPRFRWIGIVLCSKRTDRTSEPKIQLPWELGRMANTKHADKVWLSEVIRKTKHPIICNYYAQVAEAADFFDFFITEYLTELLLPWFFLVHRQQEETVSFRPACFTLYGQFWYDSFIRLWRLLRFEKYSSNAELTLNYFPISITTLPLKPPAWKFIMYSVFFLILLCTLWIQYG